MGEFHSPAGHRRRGIMGWIIGILLLILVVSLVASLFYFTAHYVMEAGTYYYPRPFFGFFLLFPLGLVFFILLIFLMFRLAFWPRRRRYYRHLRSWDSAHEILRQRYARREITKEQFEQMQQDLEQYS